jgi:hypothetical protein
MRFLPVFGLLLAMCGAAAAQDDPELIFKKSTVFRLLSPSSPSTPLTIP